MKKFLKILTASAATLGLALAAVVGTADLCTPDSYTVSEGGSLRWMSGVFSVVREDAEGVSVSTGAAYPKSYSGRLMLCNMVPVKSVQVNVVDNTSVVLCGTPFGIKMFTNGVVVVGLADIETGTGTVNPASEAGIKVGDVISAINGTGVDTNSDVEKTVEDCDGEPLNFTIRRDDQKLSIQVRPALALADSQYKVGLWVRDSTAGIGTLTYYDPGTGSFAGLGHGICDSDTGQLMPLLSGDIVPVTINGVTKGQKGAPGELRGYFADSNSIGTLWANSPSGVYGPMSSPVQGKTLKIAMKQDIKTGPVKILTTINGNTPKYYDAEIEKIDYRGNVQSKNFVLHITDIALLSQTGGIVQGMSGSPVVQNGMMVGAVTHVFVNDPTRGYGIFAECMLQQSRAVAAQYNKEAS